MEMKNFLSLQNKTKFDKFIKFKPIGHIYDFYSPFFERWISNSGGKMKIPNIISTTTILSHYFPKTNFENIAKKIFNNQENRIAMENDVNYKYYGCNSIDDILNIWNKGSLLGTKMHDKFEVFANLLEYDRYFDKNNFQNLYNSLVDFGEKSYFIEFCKRFNILNRKIEFWRTEFLVFNSELHITGSIDVILYDKINDGYILIDYKRLKGGLKKNPKKPRKSIKKLTYSSKGHNSKEFEKLRNNNENQYGCQLTLYKKLFQHMFPKKKVLGLYIVCIDSNKINYQGALEILSVGINKYDSCINEIFEQRANYIFNNYEENINYNHILKLFNYSSKNKKQNQIIKKFEEDIDMEDKSERKEEIEEDIDMEDESERKEEYLENYFYELGLDIYNIIESRYDENIQNFGYDFNLYYEDCVRKSFGQTYKKFRTDEISDAIEFYIVEDNDNPFKNSVEEFIEITKEKLQNLINSSINEFDNEII